MVYWKGRCRTIRGAISIPCVALQDSPNKVFIGGLPCDWNEKKVKDIFSPFGELKAFNLVMDRETGYSKVSSMISFL